MKKHTHFFMIVICLLFIDHAFAQAKIDIATTVTTWVKMMLTIFQIGVVGAIAHAGWQSIWKGAMEGKEALRRALLGAAVIAGAEGIWLWIKSSIATA